MKYNDVVSRVIGAYSCCEAASVRIECLPDRERSYFRAFMPKAVTALALGHHVTTQEEWTWYKNPDGGERCAADDHLKMVCESIRIELNRLGQYTELVPYPGESGLQFRFVAEAAGLGEIGTNAFLFHRTWGPWVHLRVMATTAPLDLRASTTGEQRCTQCGLCITDCPAEAISVDGFNGLQCRTYRKSKGEYEPYGPDRELRYCLACALACPQGPKPRPFS